MLSFLWGTEEKQSFTRLKAIDHGMYLSAIASISQRQETYLTFETYTYWSASVLSAHCWTFLFQRLLRTGWKGQRRGSSHAGKHKAEPTQPPAPSPLHAIPHQLFPIHVCGSLTSVLFGFRLQSAISSAGSGSSSSPRHTATRWLSRPVSNIYQPAAIL